LDLSILGYIDSIQLFINLKIGSLLTRLLKVYGKAEKSLEIHTLSLVFTKKLLCAPLIINLETVQSGSTLLIAPYQIELREVCLSYQGDHK
jgi:hypothetical protein